MIEIDSAHGGQMLRSAVGLSALTKIPCKIHNIRMQKKNPGLKTQHIHAILATQKLCNAKTISVNLGSKYIEFFPSEIDAGDISVNIETAGALSLILQALMIPISKITIPINVELNGGATYGKWAPSIHYIIYVLAPHLQKLGYNFHISVEKHGFFPKGGARVRAQFSPLSSTIPIRLEHFGEIKNIKGISIASLSLRSKRVADRQAEMARRIIKERVGIDPQINIEYVDSLCAGSGITLWVETTSTVFGADVVGEKLLSSEKIGADVSEKIINIIESKSTVDEYLADQLLVYMAMAEGESVIVSPTLTKHILTNIDVIKRFISTEFTINQNKNVKIVCRGM